MDVGDILSTRNIIMELQGITKQDVLYEFESIIQENTTLLDVPDVMESLMEREKLRSTAIGDRVAIPHCKHHTHNVHVFMGIHKQGVDFHSVDKKLVHLVFCCISPINSVNRNINTLSKLARLVKQTDIVEEMLSATDERDCLKRLRIVEQDLHLKER